VGEGAARHMRVWWLWWSQGNCRLSIVLPPDPTVHERRSLGCPSLTALSTLWAELQDRCEKAACAVNAAVGIAMAGGGTGVLVPRLGCSVPALPQARCFGQLSAPRVTTSFLKCRESVGDRLMPGIPLHEPHCCCRGFGSSATTWRREVGPLACSVASREGGASCMSGKVVSAG